MQVALCYYNRYTSLLPVMTVTSRKPSMHIVHSSLSLVTDHTARTTTHRPAVLVRDLQLQLLFCESLEDLQGHVRIHPSLDRHEQRLGE